MMIPTEFSSRLKHRPRVPPANSTISPAIADCRPTQRAIPSPTSITRPTSAVCTCPLKSSISFCRTEAISSALNFMEVPLSQAVLQVLQPRSQRTVKNCVSDLNHQPAHRRRIVHRLEHGVIGQRRFKPALNLSQLLRSQLDRTADRHPLLVRAGLMLLPGFAEDDRQQIEPLVP